MTRNNGWRAPLLILALSAASCAGFSCGVGVEESRGRNPSAIPAPPDVAAPPPDALRTPSNLASKVLTRGTGTRHPRPNSRVLVHYTGWTTDGQMFDSSMTQGNPVAFGLDEVIPGWTEGVQLMVEGEKRRFWIPAKLAYERGGGPQGTLVFDIELLKIES